jgi:hypothetical protein
MKRFKISLALIAGFLLLVVILQNTDTVETRILSATIELPRAVLLLVTVVFGFVLGFATGWWTKRRGTAKPGAVKPGAVKPGTAKPGTAKPGDVKAADPKAEAAPLSDPPGA